MAEQQHMLVELRTPQGVGEEQAAAWAAHFAVPGVVIDQGFAPVPMEGRSGSVIIRALVDSEADGMALEGRPEVVRVWKDTPVDHFNQPKVAGEDLGDVDESNLAFGAPDDADIDEGDLAF